MHGDYYNLQPDHEHILGFRYVWRRDSEHQDQLANRARVVEQHFDYHKSATEHGALRALKGWVEARGCELALAVGTV
jgi:hypothetical protein